jgi:nitroimidazol reductase NimA-like FMN-containing flavoprotein (pyridoxamine 5'-phosphate oxidase superfamily)
VERDRNGLEVLDHDQCIELLTTASFGRIGLLVDGLPVVLPVNFRMADDQVIIRTVRGTKLAAATRNAVVAFEVDEFDPQTEQGWSVMIRGIGRELLEPDHFAAIRNTPAWLGEGDARFVTISLDIVSGRRLVPTGRSAERVPLEEPVG